MNSTHLISLPVPPFRLRSHYWEFPDSMMLSPVTSTLLLSVPWRVSSSLRKSIIPCSVNLIKIALMFSPNNPNFWRARVSVVSPHSSCDVPSVMVSYDTVWFPVASRTFLGMECNILVCFNFFFSVFPSSIVSGTVPLLWCWQSRHVPADFPESLVMGALSGLFWQSCHRHPELTS